MKKANGISDERRNYFRIDDIALLSFRVVSWKEVRSVQKINPGLPMHRHTFKANLDSLSRELQPLFHMIKSSNSNVAKYLATLDKKINLLSEYCLEGDESESDIEPQSVNIGAGGISFISDKPLIIGAMLELKMRLLPEMTGIFSYARVISSVSLEEGSEQADYKIAVEFEFMDEDVRDLISRHVLDRQRALINKA